MKLLKVYIGRKNKERLQILQGDEVIDENVVNKAAINCGQFSINTENDPSIIFFEENYTVVSVKLGMIEGLTPTKETKANLIIYDDNAPSNGYFWVSFNLKIIDKYS